MFVYKILGITILGLSVAMLKEFEIAKILKKIKKEKMVSCRGE